MPSETLYGCGSMVGSRIRFSLVPRGRSVDKGVDEPDVIVDGGGLVHARRVRVRR